MILDECRRYSPWHVSQTQLSAGLGQLLKELTNRKGGLACSYIFPLKQERQWRNDPAVSANQGRTSIRCGNIRSQSGELVDNREFKGSFLGNS